MVIGVADACTLRYKKKQFTQNIASEKANFNRHSSFKDNRDSLSDVVRIKRPFRMKCHNFAEPACYKNNTYQHEAM